MDNWFWKSCKLSSLEKKIFHQKVLKKLDKYMPGDSDGKESAYSVGDMGSIPGSERSPGEEKDYPF